MQQSRFRNLLGRFVQVFPVFIDIAGDAAGGIFLGHMYFLTHYYDWDQGWIYQRYEDLYEDTRLNRKSIDRVRGLLKKKGILEERRENNPVRMFYRLDLEALDIEIERHIVEGKYAHIEHTPLRNQSDSMTDISTVQNGHLRRPNRTPELSKTDTSYEERDLRKSLKKDLKNPPFNSPQGGRATNGGKNYSEEFLTFWAAYPRREKKPQAWQAWRKQKCETIGAEVLSAVSTHPALKREPEYIPLPASWLNGRCWEDEPAMPTRDIEAENTEHEREQARRRQAVQHRYTVMEHLSWALGKPASEITDDEIDAEIERQGLAS